MVVDNVGLIDGGCAAVISSDVAAGGGDDELVGVSLWGVMVWNRGWWGSMGCKWAWGAMGHPGSVCHRLDSASLCSKGPLRIFNVVHGRDMVMLGGGSWCMTGFRGTDW